ncbi:hypothetical protein CFOL_v3_13273 [Cephalotus follicularis]|uniref:DUF4283 domain-containing protein n=1 Tax=Cephalotus follicularis TaxID=3775 RepID=A0A1Q3BPJ9_CEPFO|nr:hypothetical protein CFOL_v3_13273 [Cephalotus follicularis]
MWLRLSGLPLPSQNSAILEAFGNTIVRFLRLDERTKKLTHPMSPRLCVEMDLARNLPVHFVIAIGADDLLTQRIEYEMRIGFCSHCHLQGNQAHLCRKKNALEQPQQLPNQAFSAFRVKGAKSSKCSKIGLKWHKLQNKASKVLWKASTHLKR